MNYQKTIELTNGTLRAADSLAPIYGEFVLPQLDKGAPVDRTGMAYVPDDSDEQDCVDSMVDMDAKPKAKQKPNAAKPKPQKGAAKQHLRKGLNHPLMRPRRRMVMRNRHNRRVNSWSRHTKEIGVQRWSRKDSHSHQSDWRTLRIW